MPIYERSCAMVVTFAWVLSYRILVCWCIVTGLSAFNSRSTAPTVCVTLALAYLRLRQVIVEFPLVVCAVPMWDSAAASIFQLVPS